MAFKQFIVDVICQSILSNNYMFRFLNITATSHLACAFLSLYIIRRSETKANNVNILCEITHIWYDSRWYFSLKYCWWKMCAIPSSNYLHKHQQPLVFPNKLINVGLHRAHYFVIFFEMLCICCYRVLLLQFFSHQLASSMLTLLLTVCCI